ncbi:MAG: hypothetical protein WCA49_22165 [Candidatus Sulfotelmatobacter sp.]
MATGATPALDPKVEKKSETAETNEVQPVTLKQRIKHVLSEIFEGREDHLGWRQ